MFQKLKLRLAMTKYCQKNDELSYSGLNGEVNKKIYAKMMQYFIAEELKRFNHQ